MAENKKSVLLYCDIIHTVEELDDAEAGRLFKHYLRYINDQNPEPPDKLTKIVFEPIKQNLKRDLKKWEGFIEKQSLNGKKGGRPSHISESQITQPFIEKPKKAVKDTVKVKVTDKVIVKDIQRVIPDENFILDLPELKINNAIEYLSRTQKSEVDKPLILSLWTVFKEKNFTGEKFYKSTNDIFRHFFETLKFEKINGHSTFAKSDKHSGAMQLINSLKKDYAARRDQTPGA